MKRAIVFNECITLSCLRSALRPRFEECITPSRSKSAFQPRLRGVHHFLALGQCIMFSHSSNALHPHICVLLDHLCDECSRTSRSRSAAHSQVRGVHYTLVLQECIPSPLARSAFHPRSRGVHSILAFEGSITPSYMRSALHPRVRGMHDTSVDLQIPLSNDALAS